MNRLLTASLALSIWAPCARAASYSLAVSSQSSADLQSAADRTGRGAAATFDGAAPRAAAPVAPRTVYAPGVPRPTTLVQAHEVSSDAAPVPGGARSAPPPTLVQAHEVPLGQTPVRAAPPPTLVQSREVPSQQRGGDAAVVATAQSWEAQAHINPDTGSYNWNGWCLGFVNSVDRAATGHADPGLQAGYARAAYYNMVAEGRASTNWSQMPAGSAVFWTQGQYGHIAIFSGRYTASGDPIIITTGFGTSDAKELPLSTINAAIGASAGYAPL